MIDFSNREVKTVVKFSNDDEAPEWYEIRYCSLDKGMKFKNDLELFKWIVLDWGDDFQFKGKDWNCIDKSKEEFFWNVPDRTAKLMQKAFDKFTFGTDEAEVIKRLGKLQNTKKNGEKRNRSTTPQTVVDA